MVFPELKRPEINVERGGVVTGATVLLLHAHPDDETLGTGGLMARLVAEGVRVVLVTGTRGERGEVVPGPLKHLEGTAELAGVRVGELDAAMSDLGVADHRFLGAADARASGRAPRSYGDSGMQWGASGFAEAADDAPSDALSSAPLAEVVGDVLAVIAEVQPGVLVSYDERGGYGHPDHVRMHDAAVAAAGVTGVPLYTIVAEAAGGDDDGRGGSGSEADDSEGSTGGRSGGSEADDSDSGSSTDSSSDSDSDADARELIVPLGAFREAKVRALAAHRTQLTVDGSDIVLSGGQRRPMREVEVFRRWMVDVSDLGDASNVSDGDGDSDSAGGDDGDAANGRGPGIPRP